MHTRSRATDPWTSHAAAASAAEFAGSQRVRILSLLRASGPMTAEEIGLALGLEPYAVRKRLPELEDAGLAEPTGDVKPTASGRWQRVWRATGDYDAR
ncbi:MAG: ArsR family transcriptional regulator [Rhodocyclaceae bacterium]|nr:ArsR family transcriptional regulator [Rhodocyclaceae bacterium]